MREMSRTQAVGDVEQLSHPTYRIAAYTVYPTGYDRAADAPKREQWRVTVADAGDGWAIRWRARCMNYRGGWEFEPPSDARTADFLRRCRFNEHAALLRARRNVDDLIVDGFTFSEYAARFWEGHRENARAVLRKRRRRLWSRQSVAGEVAPDLPAGMGPTAESDNSDFPSRTG